MALSGLAMLAAAFGWLTPVASALTQEGIDVAVILNALRALTGGREIGHPAMPATAARALHQDHKDLEASLDRLREIADALDDAVPVSAVALIGEANRLVSRQIVEHERDDEGRIYPRLAKFLQDNAGLAAMSRAHREILHLARLLARLSDGLRAEDADRYLIRDAQRVIEFDRVPCAHPQRSGRGHLRACHFRIGRESGQKLEAQRSQLALAFVIASQRIKKRRPSCSI